MKTVYQNSDQSCPTNIFSKRNRSKNLSSIIFCPGLAGTCLDFDYDAPIQNLQEVLSHFDKTLWINPLGLMLNRDYFMKLLTPLYNTKKKTLENIPGLITYVHGRFNGDILASKCLTYILNMAICFPESSYAQNFVKFFTEAGYVANKNLLIVGYDFRLVPYPTYLKIYFKNFQKVIESAFKHNHQRKVSLIGHSLGCSLINMFLNTRRRQWKKRYIKCFIPISPAYDGAPDALRTVLSGNNFGLPSYFFGSNLDYREAERHMAGVITTIPYHQQMYSDDIAVIIVNTKNQTEDIYNVKNSKNGIQSILHDIAKQTNQPSLDITADILKPLQKQTRKYGWKDPGLPVYQLMVVDTITEGGAYVYDISNQGLNTDPTSVKMTLGDGLIPRFGLYLPKLYDWKNITFKIFPSTQANHVTLFTDCPIAYSYILSLVTT